MILQTGFPRKDVQTREEDRLEARSQTSSLIILLAGVPGTGKTTLGNALQKALGLSHHISTGFLRAAVESFLPAEQARFLRKQAFAAYEEWGQSEEVTGTLILKGCTAQAEILKPIMRSCIERAHREGIGLIMEGSHFIPGVVDPKEYGADLLCVLDVPNREDLKTRAMSPNHSLRRWDDFDLRRLIMLQDKLLEMAQLHDKPVVVNIDLEAAVKQVRGLLGCGNP